MSGRLLDLLDQAHRAGLCIRLVAPDRIRVDGPPEYADLARQLVPFKPQLLKMLAATREPREYWRNPTRCVECGRPLQDGRRYLCPACTWLLASSRN